MFVPPTSKDCFASAQVVCHCCLFIIPYTTLFAKMCFLEHWSAEVLLKKFDWVLGSTANNTSLLEIHSACLRIGGVVPSRIY